MFQHGTGHSECNSWSAAKLPHVARYRLFLWNTTYPWKPVNIPNWECNTWQDGTTVTQLLQLVNPRYLQFVRITKYAPVQLPIPTYNFATDPRYGFQCLVKVRMHNRYPNDIFRAFASEQLYSSISNARSSTRWGELIFESEDITNAGMAVSADKSVHRGYMYG